MKAKQKVRIAALGDLHVHGPSTRHRDLFALVAEKADVLAICGDLTNNGLPDEAKALASELRGVNIPILAVLGNHDHQSGQVDDIKAILRDAGVIFLDEENFEFRGVGFAGVKGFGGGFDRHMLASFGESAIRDFVAEAVNESLKLENSLRMLSTEKNLVVLHYAPIVETLRGEPPEIFPFLGCSRLAEAIDRFDVAAIFHGHAHIGSFQGKTTKGIPVYNCSLDLLRKRNPAHPFLVIEQ